MCVKYDPIDYWRKRGIQYKSEFECNEEFILQERMLVDYLKTIKFKTVLELGCGFGRITNLVKSKFNIDRYIAIDISPEQISNINDNNIGLIISDIHSLPIKQIKFDLILAIELFLHVKPKDISSLIKTLVSYSDNIINIDPDPDIHMHYKLDYFNFLHDFESIYKELGLNVNIKAIKNKTLNSRQFIFHAN